MSSYIHGFAWVKHVLLIGQFSFGVQLCTSAQAMETVQTEIVKPYGLMELKYIFVSVPIILGGRK